MKKKWNVRKTYLFTHNNTIRWNSKINLNIDCMIVFLSSLLLDVFYLVHRNDWGPSIVKQS